MKVYVIITLAAIGLATLAGAFYLGEAYGEAQFTCEDINRARGQDVNFWDDRDFPFGPDYNKEKLIFDI